MRLLDQLSSKIYRTGFFVAATAMLVSALPGVALARGGAFGPEIDPGAIGAAITLLLGGSLMLTSRVSRNK